MTRAYSILDRHIGVSIMAGTALVIFVLFLLLSFVGFVEGLKHVGKANFDMWQLIRYVLLSQPKNLYLLFPAAALVGSTAGLSYLAANSELIAMRAAGVSVWRIGAAVIKTGAVFILLTGLIGEYVVPVTEEMAQNGRAEALGIGFTKKKYTGVWLRQDQEFINVREVLPDKTLLRVNVYRFDEQMQLRKHVEALSADYQDGKWMLRGALISDINGASVSSRRQEFFPWQSKLTPDVLTVFTVKPESLSLWQLHQYIEHLQQNRQQTGAYELVFWRKLFSPVAIAIMLLLAIPFVFSPLRSANMGPRVFLGILIALLFYMVNLSFGSFAIISQWPPIVGAAAPPLIFLTLVFWLFRRVA
ncbi:MAG: LPS export ABC transporter permease LptG [Proteobacteria bacterium]|nr:LPS export ABC transporter permease LptG [Pseudomonadota bacterium]